MVDEEGHRVDKDDEDDEDEERVDEDESYSFTRATTTLPVKRAVNFFKAPDLVCTQRDKALEFPMYKFSFRECEEKCRETPWCNLYEMECGSTCRLNANCTSFEDSACHSFIAFTEDQDQSTRVSKHLESCNHSQRRFATLPIIFCVVGALTIVSALIAEYCIGVPSLMDSMDRAGFKHLLDGVAEVGAGVAGVDIDHHQIERRRAKREESREKARKADSLGVDTGDIDAVEASHFAGPIGMTIIFIMFAWFAGMTFMPVKDQRKPRGFCGLVSGDETPLSFADLFQFRRNYFMSNGHLHVGLEAMPQKCWRVLDEDKINEESGPPCLKWCQSEFGMWPRPLCSFLAVFGPMYRVCFKSRMYYYVHLLPSWLVTLADSYH
jgi:hypothetical protein